MLTKPLASLACALAAGALVLPACGGEEAPDAARFAPADDVRVLEQRLGAVERQLRDLRQEIRSQGAGGRSSSDEPGGEAATDRAADRDGASKPEGAGAGTRAASVTGSGSGGGGSGSGSGSGGGGSGGGGSGGGSDAGGGPDPGTPEDDPSVEDICGPNPAPEC
ncbi:MAG TPA: hypothetical protein VGV57_00785 [Thermoleophilaceae bacterium]|nr:hypothetical protein [Thermoleophilaceae bacterium]